MNVSQNATFDQQMSNGKADAMKEELHMAEMLVENAAMQQKTAFQFDTLTPKVAKNCDQDKPTRDDCADEPTRDECALDSKWKPHLRGGAKSFSGNVELTL